MNIINFSVEDDLSESVLRKILITEGKIAGRRYPDRDRVSVSPGKGHLLNKIIQYNNFSRLDRFIMLLDLDQEKCGPSAYRRLKPAQQNPGFFLRFAVREIESWILADRKGFANFLGLSVGQMPPDPEALMDPKGTLISLARRSRYRIIREAIVPEPGVGASIGKDYNGTLMGFVSDHWNIDEATAKSDSLRRTRRAISES